MQQPTIRIALLAGLALVGIVLAACQPAAIPNAAPPSSAANQCPGPPRTAADAPKLLALMNAERARAGVPALVLSPRISAVAQAFACEAAARRDIAHIASDGSSLTERLRRGGISATMVAENNASFYRTPEQVMAAWMASPHHRENILRPNARLVGIGQADGIEAVWVVDFTS